MGGEEGLGEAHGRHRPLHVPHAVAIKPALLAGELVHGHRPFALLAGRDGVDVAVEDEVAAPIVAVAGRDYVRLLGHAGGDLHIEAPRAEKLPDDDSGPAGVPGGFTLRAATSAAQRAISSSRAASTKSSIR